MDSDQEIEWDFNSIKRYKKLLMFESEYPIRQMELLGGSSRLCCLSDRDLSASLLTVYNLPPRLSSSDSKVSLSPNFDLKIVGGTYNKNRITQIGCLESSDWLVASEQNAPELLIFSLNSINSDKLVMSGVVSCDGLTNPAISVGSDSVIACRHSSNPISILDMMSRCEKGRRMWHDGENILIKPIHLSANTFLVYSSQQLSALLFDTRQEQKFSILKGDAMDTGYWTTAGCGFKEGVNLETHNVGFLSNAGKAQFYDLRNLESPYSMLNLRCHSNGLPECKELWGIDSSSTNSREARLCISLNPLNESVAAVSGLDSRVYVVDTSNNCSILFTHDGHEHMESNLGVETITTSHMFYHPGGLHSLISTADNSSINCWTYNTH